MNARMSPLFGITLLASVAALALPGDAGATRYRDAAGDVRPGSGPDVVSVVVSNGAKRVTFTVRFASAPPLDVSAKGKWVDMLIVGIDVPPLGPAPVSSS